MQLEVGLRPNQRLKRKYLGRNYLNHTSMKLVTVIVRLRSSLFHYAANISLFTGSNRNTGKSCEICSKLTIITQERRH